MPQPPNCRTVAFFDTQNLYRFVKDCFGYTYPNFDPVKLATFICKQKGWQLTQTRLYTGVPRIESDPFWHTFWSNKIAILKRKGVYCFKRELVTRIKEMNLPDGTIEKVPFLMEKGIDVRIAIDIITMARKNLYDVALLFSQDQDLSEVALEIRSIAHEQCRWIKTACAFPEGRTRGIDNTEWIQISKADYDRCIDPSDYRGASKSSS